MNTAAIRAQILCAQTHEATTGLLAKHLATQLPQLHTAIELPDFDKNEVMTRFVSAYIEQVPDLLDAANDVAHKAGIESQITPVLRIAEHYFTDDQALLKGHEGLEALLDEAYLAHRLVEEVNDVYIKHFGQPLIPLDTTVANIIAHQLIGEAFANQLDEAVHLAVDEMLDDENFALEAVEAYRKKLVSPDTGTAWSQWPCMSKQLGVGLTF
ncbi:MULTISPECIES: hypothetical protein [unclassified Pseudomonas]|uniref:hypothetical protein n=1 Tax=unclassified Pseudomonas TaxID=196821 RepID=UPI0028D334DE|nr:hypothetical protein [uncultured Pseudomonas sp.]